MKKYLSLVAIGCGLILMGAPAMATTTTIPTTLQDLINDNAVGGFQIQDKIFSNFVYTPTDPVGDAAANIKVATIFNPLPTGDQHGFNFTNSTGVWDNGFSLSYRVDVVPGSTNRIVKSFDQISDGLNFNANPNVTDTQSVGLLITSNTSNATLSNSITYSPVSFVTTSSVATATSTNPLNSYEQDWFELPSAVPEPTSLLLLGLGLFGLGAVGRKVKK